MSQVGTYTLSAAAPTSSHGLVTMSCAASNNKNKNMVMLQMNSENKSVTFGGNCRSQRSRRDVTAVSIAQVDLSVSLHHFPVTSTAAAHTTAVTTAAPREYLQVCCDVQFTSTELHQSNNNCLHTDRVCMNSRWISQMLTV